jgi:hypothetical protein
VLAAAGGRALAIESVAARSGRHEAAIGRSGAQAACDLAGRRRATAVTAEVFVTEQEATGGLEAVRTETRINPICGTRDGVLAHDDWIIAMTRDACADRSRVWLAKRSKRNGVGAERKRHQGSRDTERSYDTTDHAVSDGAASAIAAATSPVPAK